MRWIPPVLLTACLMPATGLPDLGADSRLLALGAPAGEHRAIGETHGKERTIFLDGEVRAFHFANPQSVLHVRVLGDRGLARTWAVEWRAADRLSAGGHHAIGEIYDEERTIVLDGEVEAFHFGNPHSVLHVRVRDDGGLTRTWAVEWRAADRLSRAGVRGDALARGDAVTLCGHPGRDPGAYRLYLLNVARRAAGPEAEAETRAALCERESSPEIATLSRR